MSGFGDTCIVATGLERVMMEHDTDTSEIYLKYQELHPKSLLVEINISNHDPLIDEIRISKDLVILEDVNYS